MEVQGGLADVGSYVEEHARSLARRGEAAAQVVAPRETPGDPAHGRRAALGQHPFGKGTGTVAQPESGALGELLKTHSLEKSVDPHVNGDLLASAALEVCGANHKADGGGIQEADGGVVPGVDEGCGARHFRNKPVV